MHMLKERLQIMIDAEQRSRLNAEAKRLGTSVGSVVRDAIDDRLGRGGRGERVAAVQAMERRASGRSLTIAEMDRILDEGRSRRVDPLGRL